ncbi:MAG: type VI secretion system baseplate subunit TssF [Deltaproteobacteria bacterium]|nr:type VI secretion system baseplate subunit TssF [Deltaproteobacteria bacterium]
MSDRYYRQEFNYLVEEGREFSERYPDLAWQLNLTDSRGRDPNVERLLEGFAFLTSRIQMRLDDDMPQLADGLLSLLWPHYGRHIPSFCLMQFRPQAGELAEGLTVPAGAVVVSDALQSGLRCRYSTCFPLWVPPVTITGFAAESLGTACRLSLSFKPAAGVQPATLADHPLRVQMFGESHSCQEACNLLLGQEGDRRYLRQVVLKVTSGGQEETISLDPDTTITSCGLSQEESLFPSGNDLFWGFTLLQDYFVFPDKFLAFNLNLGAVLARYPKIEKFEVECRVEHAWPTDLSLTQDNFRLGVVPAVNLFRMDGEPIRADHLRSSYRIKVDIQNPEAFLIYTVDKVEGISLSDGRRRIYQPLYAVRHRLEGPREQLEGPYYVLGRTRAPGGGSDLTLGLVDPAGKGVFPEEETLSLSLTCSNGGQGGRPPAGRIRQTLAGAPDLLKPVNLNQPSQPIFPQTQGRSVWSWLGIASLNFLNLANPDRLRALLAMFEPGQDEANQRRLTGIRTVKLEDVRERVFGSLVSGHRLKVVVDEDHFGGQGDTQLFAKVLGAFLEAFASINCFLRLEVTLLPSGRKIMLGRTFGREKVL